MTVGVMAVTMVVGAMAMIAMAVVVAEAMAAVESWPAFYRVTQSDKELSVRTMPHRRSFQSSQPLRLGDGSLGSVRLEGAIYVACVWHETLLS